MTMKIIPLTQGKVALVDDEDFEHVNQFKWCAQKRVFKSGITFYAMRRGGAESMHRFLMPSHPRIDHKDGDGLNNQRSNLRPATRSENAANQRKHVDCSSKFKGVHWDKRTGKWRSQTKLHGRRIHLGRFVNELDAAIAYDTAAVKLFGDFAKLNFA